MQLPVSGSNSTCSNEPEAQGEACAPSTAAGRYFETMKTRPFPDWAPPECCSFFLKQQSAGSETKKTLLIRAQRLLRDENMRPVWNGIKDHASKIAYPHEASTTEFFRSAIVGLRGPRTTHASAALDAAERLQRALYSRPRLDPIFVYWRREAPNLDVFRATLDELVAELTARISERDHAWTNPGNIELGRDYNNRAVVNFFVKYLTDECRKLFGRPCRSWVAVTASAAFNLHPPLVPRHVNRVAP